MFEEKIDVFIEENKLLQKETTVVIGVSGGADSLALLYYLHSRKEKYNLRLIVAHVDHMFRGEESYEDLRYVHKVSDNLSIPCEFVQIDVASYQRKHGLGVQAAARECRYRFFEEVMKKYNSDYLALGHHGDDQVETILMRLVRGSTAAGYAGIPMKRQFSTGWIIRPFLIVTKEEIEEYCKKRDIVPRVDKSNFKEDYTRNRFRKHVLPYLKKENHRVHERFQTFSKIMQEDEDYLQELAIEKMNKVVKKKDKNKVVLAIPSFESMAMALQRRGIQLILNYLYQDNPSSLSSIHINKVLSLIKRDHPSGSLDFPEGLKVIRTYEECIFSFDKEQCFPFSYNVAVPGTIDLPNGDQLIVEKSSCFLDSYDTTTTFVALTKELKLPLTVRSRKDGDRMTVKGMNGTKKIKAIFIDKKVPKHLRDYWPIVCDNDGVIIWVPLIQKSSLETAERNADSYVLIHYKSKESSRRISHDESRY
ncbi:tRNA lysidine(34) synthetase TilS [Bacillus sp. 165]|uniref:tRNA lysidine(34) synthetase TilS n=1 Tax=Bacillus sp. 165 TaxID=1529117 RepID=UPI001AD9FD25|nr:tRNA lysidine(34) synthetase TilS [Bacillus sp. 165]MBO9131315.1 tRNA lysidine(34) synthetase TilS [Bacillus sp. 165]